MCVFIALYTCDLLNRHIEKITCTCNASRTGPAYVAIILLKKERKRTQSKNRRDLESDKSVLFHAAFHYMYMFYIAASSFQCQKVIKIGRRWTTFALRAQDNYALDEWRSALIFCIDCHTYTYSDSGVVPLNWLRKFLLCCWTLQHSFFTFQRTTWYTSPIRSAHISHLAVCLTCSMCRNIHAT